MPTRPASIRRRTISDPEFGQPLDRALQQFPHGVGALNGAERFDVLDNWVHVLDNLYAHLPLKLALYGFSPVRAIERLRQQVSELSDLQFHRELMMLINRLRDAHTQYSGPKTLQRAVASLPFLVESFGSASEPSYLVTKVNQRIVRNEPHFVPGVKVEFWNGVPFDRAVDLHAEVETGGRPDARRARAVESLTLRALGYLPPPEEKWVIVQYRDLKDKVREIRFNWRVVYPDRDPRASRSYSVRTRRAINSAAESLRRAKKLMFNTELWKAERNPKKAARGGSSATGYEDFLSARPVLNRKYGYLRIWSFDVNDYQGFLDAAKQLLNTLPDRGLIIDLSNNPGGLIWAAERMLQLFTPNSITPTKFALRATPVTAAMAAGALNQQELGPWAASLTSAAGTGELYSSHLPITSVEQCNDLGQFYGGPVVVVVDANTYSAGDLFTAGIVDNRVGPVLCIGEATGAGGANVWASDDVSAAMESAGVPLPALPQGTGFTVAVRRAVRSGDADGTLIEDTGIAGQTYAMTRNDILDGNRDLIRYCAKLLAAQPWTRLNVNVDRDKVNIETAGLDQVDVYADGHADRASIGIAHDGTHQIALSGGIQSIEVVGFAEKVVRQRRRLTVNPH